jgi:DNA-binding GntR family transcriptional regulator
MSKSEIIKDMYSRLGWPLLRVQNLSFTNKGKIEKSITEHEIIIDLLSKQDMEELSIVLLKHNKDVISNIQTMLRS